MTGEIQRRLPASQEIAQITADYEPRRIAGIWDSKPRRLPLDPFPFLAISQSRHHIPLKSMPLFRIDADVASQESIFPFPRIQPTDAREELQQRYSDEAEFGYVAVIKKRRLPLPGQEPQRQVRLWIPRFLNPMTIHPPVMEAVSTFMQSVGADWDPGTFKETGINEHFQVKKSPVPNQELLLELGGPPQVVTTSALAASAMRLAICETIVAHDNRRYLSHLQATQGFELTQVMPTNLYE